MIDVTVGRARLLMTIDRLVLINPVCGEGKLRSLRLSASEQMGCTQSQGAPFSFAGGRGPKSFVPSPSRTACQANFYVRISK